MKSLMLDKFISTLLSLDQVRTGADFFGNESKSLICLDLLFNQRVGVERATSVAIALHDHFRRPFKNIHELVSDVTKFPYEDKELRPPGKSVLNMLNSFHSSDSLLNLKLSELCSYSIGGLASLERYYNRSNDFFNVIRKSELFPEEVMSLNANKALEISRIKLPEANLDKQLASAAQILIMLKKPEWDVTELRTQLKKLPRVGDEAADTFIIYLFSMPAIIVDEYLRRILYRHGLIANQKISRTQIVKLIQPRIKTHDDSHRLHARIDEIGVLYCHVTDPDCANCPLIKSCQV